jgi:GH24 family phage-related lysozyme (muramidase)
MKVYLAIFIIFIILIGGYFNSSKESKPEINIVLDNDLNQILISSVSLIKKYEGFSDKVYKCPSGQNTIGYGDTLFLKQYGSNLKIDNKDFENLLHLRVQNIIFDIKYKYFYENHSYLSNNELAALSSLIYNIGEGNFVKSTLFLKIKKNLEYKRKNDKKYMVHMKTSISREWKKWIFFKDKTGKIIKSSCKKEGKCLENRRNDEIDLFFIS